MVNHPNRSQGALDSQARRAAAKVGLKATKSRWRRDSIDNYGNFMLVDPMKNYIVAGQRFDMSAEDVIEYRAPKGVVRDIWRAIEVIDAAE
jgi:hypothetical protein